MDPVSAGSSHRIGIAVSRGRLVAVTARRTLRGLRPAAVHACDLEAGPDSAGDGGAERKRRSEPAEPFPGLSAALAQLASRLEEGARLEVALLPPLARTKVIPLPPARRPDLRRLLARDASRHFLAASREQVVVDAAPPGRGSPRGRDGRSATVPAAVAETRAVEAILAAARSAGFDVGEVAPAETAALAGARTLHPELTRGRVRLTLRDPAWPVDLVCRDGSLLAVEPRETRLAPGGPAGGEGPGGPGGDGERRVDPADVPSLADLEPAALAAFGALVRARGGLSLLPDGERRARRRAGRSVALRLASAAALLLVAAAGLELWGVRREVAAVQSRRDALAPQVEEAMAERDAARELSSILEAVRTATSDRPDRTGTVAALARALPRSAYLRSLELGRAGGRLTGTARSASALVPALENAGGIHDVALTSTRRAATGSDGQAFEITFHTGSDRAGVRPDPTGKGVRPDSAGGDVQPDSAGNDMGPDSAGVPAGPASGDEPPDTAAPARGGSR